MKLDYRIDLTGEIAETKVDIFGENVAHSQKPTFAAINPHI
jgi:hypothetical protein